MAYAANYINQNTTLLPNGVTLDVDIIDSRGKLRRTAEFIMGSSNKYNSSVPASII